MVKGLSVAVAKLVTRTIAILTSNQRHNFCYQSGTEKTRKQVRKIFLVSIILLLSVNLFAQTIRVVDARSGQPVEGVVLFDGKNSVQTDVDGKVRTDIFENKTSIQFKHTSYLPYKSVKQRIVQHGKIVLLVADPVKLDEIVVSLNRWEQSKDETPFTVKAIQADEVLRYNPQTAADLVRQKGGVFIQKSQMGGGSPMIRGFSANRLLIVIDGVRLNNAIYRNGNLHNIISLDAAGTSSAEIIFGPGSVIYGSDALGGVMSFNALKPKLTTTAVYEHSGKVLTRFSSANFEKTVNATYNFGSKKWAAVVNATFTDFDDLRMGSRGPDEYLRPEFVSDKPFDGADEIIANQNPEIQRYTAYKQFNFLTKLRYRPNEKFDLVLSAHHSHVGDIPRYDRLIEYKNDKLSYAEWYYGPQIWSFFSGQLQYNKKNRFFDKMNLLAGYQQYVESRNDRKLNKTTRNERTEVVDIFSFNIDFDKQFDTKSELFYGAEFYYNIVHSKGIARELPGNTTTTIASRYPDASTYGSGAAYISYKYLLNEKLIFQTGTRYTFTHLEGKFDNAFYHFPFSGFNMNNAALNGNLGLVWHPTQNWQINLHASSGFRSPNIDDVSRVFDSEPGHVVVPNPDLEPEYARNFELNIVRNYNQKARIELSGFYTLLNNAMVRRDFMLNGQDSMMYDGTLSKVEALVNAESANIYGVSLSVEYLFTRELRTRHDFTFTKGKDAEGFPVRHVPPTFGNSHLIYEKNKLFVDFYADFSGKLDFDDLAPDERDKPHLYLPDENGNPYSPGWWTLNLKSSYALNQKVTIAAGVENITDNRYRSYSSGIVSPGVNFTGSVVYRF